MIHVILSILNKSWHVSANVVLCVFAMDVLLILLFV